MSHSNRHAGKAQFFTAQDAVRLALGAYYNASSYLRFRCTPGGVLGAEPAGDDAPHAEVIDEAWFLGQWMESLSNKMRDDAQTALHHAEIIRRWGLGDEAEKTTPENAQFATLENAADNGTTTGPDYVR